MRGVYRNLLHHIAAGIDLGTAARQHSRNGFRQSWIQTVALALLSLLEIRSQGKINCLESFFERAEKM